MGSKGGWRGREPLSRELVIAAAHAQVAEGGLGSLSSRSLAARLDVTPMALYRHVENMDEVVGAVVDRLLADIGTPPHVEDWRRWLVEFACDLRAMLSVHPDAMTLFTRRPVTSPAARERFDAAVDVMQAAGFAPEDATHAYAVVHTFTIGFSALEAGRRTTPRPAGPLDAPDDAASRAIRGFVSDEQFVRGLRALVDGLAPAGAA